MSILFVRKLSEQFFFHIVHVIILIWFYRHCICYQSLPVLSGCFFSICRLRYSSLLFDYTENLIRYNIIKLRCFSYVSSIPNNAAAPITDIVALFRNDYSLLINTLDIGKYRDSCTVKNTIAQFRHSTVTTRSRSLADNFVTLWMDEFYFVAIYDDDLDFACAKSDTNNRFIEIALDQNISLKALSAGFVERVERLTVSTLSSLAGYYLKTQAPYV